MMEIVMMERKKERRKMEHFQQEVSLSKYPNKKAH
jgi:hypothetical protein